MTSPATTRSDVELARLRRRSVGALVASVALGSTGYVAAITVGTLAAQEIVGDASLSGIPAASIVLGSAIGASTLSALMVRRGRRFGQTTGYALAVFGALGAAMAVAAGSLPLLIVTALFIGFGNSASQLARYAAADLYPASGRGRAIGVVVWGATIGAVVGPNLVAVGALLAENLGLPPLTGPYLVPAGFVALAGLTSWAFLRPDPFELAYVSPDTPADPGPPVPISHVLVRPPVVAAITALSVGQIVMILIMTMTPIHMRMHDHELGAIGLVFSAHTFGMFALSPLAGWLADRFGTVPVILLGNAILAFAALLSAAAPPDGGAGLFIALFLLGWGWNLGFVAGSQLLTTGLEGAVRTRVEGLVDTLIWTLGAGASITSGIVLGVAGYATLGVLGAALVVIPVIVVLNRRGRIAALTGAAAG
jgi:MFS family permease